MNQKPDPVLPSVPGTDDTASTSGNPGLSHLDPCTYPGSTPETQDELRALARELEDSEGQPSPQKIPKFPEFKEIVLEFEMGRSFLKGHANAIFQIAERLIHLRTRMSDVQDFWMETGCSDIALRMDPVLHAG